MQGGLRTPLLVVGAVIVLVVGCYLVLYAVAKPRQYVNMGTPIRQDDFTYTVVGVHKAATLGHGARQICARGIFYIVQVRLDNHALRVPFEWDDGIVRIIDSGNQTYRADGAAQKLLLAATPVEHAVPPGASATFPVAFDLPTSVRGPAVAFENGILMGDAFNFVAYRRVAVALQ
jgi:hypothetical protein